MPNNEQAKKRVRQNEQRRMHNKTVRSSMRSAMKKVLQADSPEAAKEALPQAMKRNKPFCTRLGIPDGNMPAVAMIVGHPAVPFQRAVRRRFSHVAHTTTT